MLGTSSEMNEAVFAALCACLDLTPGTDAANALIHGAYLDPENAPQPPRNRDVIYYWLERDEATNDNGQSLVTGKDGDWDPGMVPTDIISFLAYKLMIVCYGPHAEDYAHRIRSLLYLDGTQKPRGILRAAGIYPIPRPAQPVLLREPAGSLWRKRADLAVSLRVRDEIKTHQPAVKIAPEVKIYKE